GRRHERPLDAGGEAGTAAPSEAGGLHLVDDLGGRHGGERLAGRLVAAGGAVALEGVRPLDAHAAVHGDLVALVVAAEDALRAGGRLVAHASPPAAPPNGVAFSAPSLSPPRSRHGSGISSRLSASRRCRQRLLVTRS